MTAQENPETPKVGRPTKYKSEYADLARKFCLLGATDDNLAEFFEVHQDTINEWKNKHPEFSESIREGKIEADAHVAGSLHERATGYKYTEAVPIKVKEVTYKDGKRVKEYERVEVTMVQRVVPPDTRAIQYWMNNRRRKRESKEDQTATPVWAERQEIDHTTKGEALPAPHVYLPQDLPRSVVPEAPPITP